METLLFTTAAGSLLSTSTVYDLVEDQSVRGTTVAGLITSLTSACAMGTAEAKNVDMTNKYIESLSDDELYRMEQLLSDKEESFMIEEVNEKVKSM